MRRLVREALEAGALGLSITRNMNHFDIAGTRIPAASAPESELFALADVLREAGTGVIQCGGGTNPEMKDSPAEPHLPGMRPAHHVQHAPGAGAAARAVEGRTSPTSRRRRKQGIRAIPLVNPGSVVNRFTMKNCQVFRGMPTWLPILQAADAEKLAAYRDPPMRAKLRAEVDAPLTPDSTFSKRWDLMIVEEPKSSRRTADLRGRSVAEIAKAQGKDAGRRLPRPRGRREARDRLQPRRDQHGHRGGGRRSSGARYAVVGLSDGGAHVQFHSNVSNPTRLLGYWVREKGIMTLEHAVRRLTFDSATAFGIYDRGLLQPGMAADIVVFDADTVRPVPEDVVHDFPANGWRMRELAEGIHYTVVNGEVLLEKGTHTGAHPGQGAAQRPVPVAPGPILDRERPGHGSMRSTASTRTPAAPRSGARDVSRT